MTAGRLSPLVWNRDERRPRAGWRIVLAVVAFVIVTGVATTVALVIGGIVVPEAIGSFDGLLILTAPVALAGTLAFLWAFAVTIDRRHLSDYGLGIDRRWLIDAAFGFVLGGVLMTAIFLVKFLAGWVEVVGVAGSPPWASFGAAMSAVVIAFLAVGIYEELFVRGYLLTNIAEGLAGSSDGSRWGTALSLAPVGAILLATIVSSAAFGLLHAGNPGATAVSVVTITLAGVVLALGYLLTGELAIPIGLHVSWNLFQGSVYDLPVSGIDFDVSLLVVERQGPATITGGAFGPEAGLLGIGGLLLGAIAIVGWVYRRTGAVTIDETIVKPDLRWVENN